MNPHINVTDEYWFRNMSMDIEATRELYEELERNYQFEILPAFEFLEEIEDKLLPDNYTLNNESYGLIQEYIKSKQMISY